MKVFDTIDYPDISKLKEINVESFLTLDDVSRIACVDPTRQ